MRFELLLLRWKMGLRCAISEGMASLKKMFGWQFASVFGFGLFLAGIGAMLADKYDTAIVLYFLGGLWLAGWWFLEHPKSKWKGSSCAVIGMLALCLWTRHLQLGYELQSLYGVLLPANDPDPPTMCDSQVKPGNLKLLIGPAVIIAKKFPFTVIAMQIDGKNETTTPLITIDRDPKGHVEVTSDVFGADGKLIAQVSKNELNVSESQIFRTHRERPDRSTLDITDEYGQQALYIRFMNNRSMRFLGRLHYRLVPTVAFIITTDTAYISGTNERDALTNVCTAFDSSAPSIFFNIHVKQLEP